MRRLWTLRRGTIAVALVVATVAGGAGVASAQASPDNDSFVTARPITAPSTSRGTTSLATGEVGEPRGCSITDGSVWFVFTP